MPLKRSYGARILGQKAWLEIVIEGEKFSRTLLASMGVISKHVKETCQHRNVKKQRGDNNTSNHNQIHQGPLTPIEPPVKEQKIQNNAKKSNLRCP